MKITISLKALLRIALTLLVVAVAVFIGDTLWNRYMNSPWTRDGRVRADVINVAADVSGLVIDVPVQDNAFVHKGKLLMKIDPARYRIALAQAELHPAGLKDRLVFGELRKDILRMFIRVSRQRRQQ